jgi:glycosyltransferase involved in cell wall biosynthesis
MAAPNVRLVGRVDDERVAQLLSGCRALVVTATEEFGIAAVEAQAAGRPVIGLAAGGVCETVNEGVTGTLWSGGAEDLAIAVRNFDVEAVDPAACVDNAHRFGVARFQEALTREVDELLSESKPEHHEARRARAFQPRSPRGLGRRLR